MRMTVHTRKETAQICLACLTTSRAEMSTWLKQASAAQGRMTAQSSGPIALSTSQWSLSSHWWAVLIPFGSSLFVVTAWMCVKRSHNLHVEKLQSLSPTVENRDLKIHRSFFFFLLRFYPSFSWKSNTENKALYLISFHNPWHKPRVSSSPR